MTCALFKTGEEIGCGKIVVIGPGNRYIIDQTMTRVATVTVLKLAPTRH
jgi:arginine exporter protein ArgO